MIEPDTICQTPTRNRDRAGVFFSSSGRSTARTFAGRPAAGHRSTAGRTRYWPTRSATAVGNSRSRRRDRRGPNPAQPDRRQGQPTAARMSREREDGRGRPTTPPDARNAPCDAQRTFPATFRRRTARTMTRRRTESNAATPVVV